MGSEWLCINRVQVQDEGEEKERRMSDTKSVLSITLLSLQLCLGFWQIGKLTPAGALIQCGIGWLLSLCRIPLGVAADYRRLRHLPGGMYKKVRCHFTTEQLTLRTPKNREPFKDKVSSYYLGIPFELHRRGQYSNELYVNQRLCYYITDPIWSALLDFTEVAPKTVVLKGYKEFWQQVATGGVMSLWDVLDSLILENHAVRDVDNDLLLPVNLSVSEEKMLKALNLAGLFLQTREVSWVVPLVVSFAAALLEFSTTVRVCLYQNINLLFCRGMHLICDVLPRANRRQIYSLGNWVEGLKPSNDLRLRVVRGDICAVIAGGARVSREGATLFQGEEDISLELLEGETKMKKIIPCGKLDADYQPIDIVCSFDATESKCHLAATTIALADLECSMAEFAKLYRFMTCVAKNRSGSLKSCDSRNKVRVRGFREAIACYSKNEFPPVYELKLDDVIVE